MDQGGKDGSGRERIARGASAPSQSALSDAMFEALADDDAPAARLILDQGWVYQPVRDPSRQEQPARAPGMRVVASAGSSAWWSPMMLAAFEGSLECARVLVERGAPVSESDEGSGLTPLHFAAQQSEPALVELLLAAGADPRARSLDGQTPLHRAIFSGCERGARALIAAGADPNALAADGETPLESALFEADSELILELLQGGADPWRPRKNGGETLAAALRRQAGLWRGGGEAVIGAMEALRESSELGVSVPPAPIARSRGGAI